MMLLALLAQTPTPTAPGGGSSGGLGSLLIFLPFAALLFFMMRKQGKQRREHMTLVQSVQVGDEVETVAGMFGTIRRTSDEAIWVELAPGVEVKMARGAIRRKIVHLEGGSA